jgi:hypothetical protein
MSRRYRRNELLKEFGNIHPRFAAATTAFLDEECFEDNFRKWVAEECLRGDEANGAMLDHLWNWFDGLSNEEFREIYAHDPRELTSG